MADGAEQATRLVPTMASTHESTATRVPDSGGRSVVPARVLGARYFWLEVISVKRGDFRVRCDCGTEKRIRTTYWGVVKSCGCKHAELARINNTRHGGYYTAENNVWRCMLQRCTNQNNPRYADYGGRGIAVCEHWLSFENFLADMGARPSADHQIERIDNDRGYEPGNCKWLIRKMQQRNRRSSRFLMCNLASLEVKGCILLGDAGKSRDLTLTEEGWRQLGFVKCAHCGPFVEPGKAVA